MNRQMVVVISVLLNIIAFASGVNGKTDLTFGLYFKNSLASFLK